MHLEPTHRYAQQATKLTQQLFIWTSVATVLFIAAAIWLNRWWGIGVLAIIAFWGIYTASMKTVPVRDLTEKRDLTINAAVWKAFKTTYPNQVAKPGTK
ncbi:hypothetical protein [Lacticaseibacillus porcinae]|uniref:hypothetical protein n=1 Tax=Lacticaseibacillus porcinae TaxID=1123687 RepID=UPI000F7B31D0|nr:hypothetical protein [Lacticaseibacillus porcinae]